jgi:hypothetical protein
VQDREGDVARGVAGQLLVAEEPLRQRGRAGDHLVTLLLRQRREIRLEELAHDAEGELLLEVGAAGDEHLEAGLRRERARLGDQSRLPHPGTALDRHDPARARGRRGDDGVQRRELGLALEQRGGRDRHLRSAARNARLLLLLARRERRELPGQARDLELVEPLGPLDVRQRGLAEVAQPQVGPELAAHQGRRGAREQHLAAVPRVADPRRLVHRQADVAVRADARLAGVQAHPDANVDVVGPLLLGERTLRRRRRLHAGTGAAEDDEERVALGLDLHPATVGEGRAQEAVVGRQDLPVPVAPQLREQPSRAFDIGKQEGNRARGQGCGRLAYCRCAQCCEIPLVTARSLNCRATADQTLGAILGCSPMRMTHARAHDGTA